MITNSEIADLLSLNAKLLELHDGDERRIKTFANAAYMIERLEAPIYEMSDKQVLDIQGIGKMLAAIIAEIIQTGTFADLEKNQSEIPTGVIDLFKVKGLGVKKIKILWHELEIENIADLKTACIQNKIAHVKGFGTKTQDSILVSIAFLEEQKGKLRMDKALQLSEQIKEILEVQYENIQVSGQVANSSEVVNKLTFIIPSDGKNFTIENPLFIKNWTLSNPFKWIGTFDHSETLIEIIFSENSVVDTLISTSNEAHLLTKNESGKTLFSILKKNKFESEEAIYQAFGSAYILPEMRTGNGEFEWVKKHANDDLITWNDLKGTVHNHSTYSDGKHSLRQMAERCQQLGFEYFGIADHSQTASYAQGLQPARVKIQHDEIDFLNSDLTSLKILKGIESDILLDGSLDYEEEILASFDYVVASVHQTLSMDIVKATDRLIKAIENPYTTLLGHPTGRLLLARDGYPFDYKTIIDACAEYNVIMELNASPYRLDLDWRWIPYCIEKGVMISINPDAHEMDGLYDMHYGVAVARKGGLTKNMTFNALNYEEITNHFKNKKPQS